MNLRGATKLNNLVKDENGDLLADSHNTLNRCKNHYSHSSSYVKQMNINTAEPLAPGPNPLDLELLLQS
jgi:hypothetical protein